MKSGKKKEISRGGSNMCKGPEGRYCMAGQRPKKSLMIQSTRWEMKDETGEEN